MTPEQIELVENSWDFVILKTKHAGKIFYDKLFELDPQLRNLFKGDIYVQSEKLIALITFAVSKLNNLSEIVDDVRALGIRHRNYNVKPEHYATVATALLATLEASLGNKWNDKMKQAWVAVYTILSKTMIEASEAVVK